MKIYDFDNEAKEAELQDKPIQLIGVRVLSGDEVVTVYYEDGTRDYFDAGTGRMMDFEDGCYEVPPEQLEQWMNFDEPCGEHETMSYKRQEAFSLGGKFCNVDDLAEIIAEAIKEAD